MDQNVELMYRPPGRDTHINIVDALNELFERIDKIESILSDMELNNES